MLAACELDKDKLTIPQLRRIAAVYKRPLAIFYLPERPTSFQPIRDFRRLPDAGINTLGPKLRLEFRRANERRRVAIDLAAEVDRPLKPFTLRCTLNEDPNVIGTRLRDVLGVTLAQQRQWRNAHTAFLRWRERIEALDVLVFQATSIDAKVARGFSIYNETWPAIVVNRKDAWAGRIFTLFHELTHLLLRTSGVCDLHEKSRSVSMESTIERFCNAVAGAMLVPTDAVLAHPLVMAHGSSKVWNDEELLELANHFSCSRETVLRRLLILDRTTKAFYEQKRKDYGEEWESTKRQRVSNQKDMKRNIPVETISSVGTPFIRLALQTYNQQRITLNDLSDILGIQTRHVVTIQKRLALSPE
jgi:Zn-dependent peptidase ImmA (M78 family)